MKLYYSDAYVINNTEFDTTRKARWVAASLAENPVPGVTSEAPRVLGWTQFHRLHDSEYVNAVRNGSPRRMAESSGLPWVTETPMAVRASCSGVVAAVRSAIEDGVAGSLSSGLHHANYGTGAGFCTFNGLAMAAYAAHELDERRVLVIDFDAHCGGGTFSLMGERDWFFQLDVATSTFDIYHDRFGRSTLTVVGVGVDYLPTVRRCLEEFDPTSVDVVIYNAGMDPHEDCDLGGLRGVNDETLAAREEMVFDWARAAGLPVAFVLAGGYVGEGMSRDRLVNLHRLTVESAAR